MISLINISLLIYFSLVSVIGTLGNSVILIAYGNRWNSSKSTSVVFILILACIDLWTCLIVVPTIALMEYREFDVPTPICRFYSFSKNLIIISSFTMSFIAFDRFLNIALPHYRLLNPRRVKVLTILIIAIAIGLGTLTALAFSTQPIHQSFIANYTVILLNESVPVNKVEDILLDADTMLNDTNAFLDSLSVPIGANITNLTVEYKSTVKRCFADTSYISETVRDMLKDVSNKAFFTFVGIVTIFYTITFVLALHRQNPRIRALKRSLNVLSKFNSQESAEAQLFQPNSSNAAKVCSYPTIITAPVSMTQESIENSKYRFSDQNLISTQTLLQSSNTVNENDYEMTNFLNNDHTNNRNHSSSLRSTQSLKTKSSLEQECHASLSDGISIDIAPLTEKVSNVKQVSFQIDGGDHSQNKEPDHPILISSNIFEADSDVTNDMYYRLPCPCSTTRQLLIRFHFTKPSSKFAEWLCCRCIRDWSPASKQIASHNRSPNELTKSVTMPMTINNTTTSHSETLRRQLHRQRLKQIRMASTFLIITVSFFLFYFPSILNAQRIIKSPIWIYYLYLCTHALNPIIYCFMNRSLREYIVSMFNCRKTTADRNTNKGRPSLFDR